MGLDAKGTLPELATAAKDADEAVRKMAKRAIEKINAAIDVQKAEQLSATIAPLITALKDKEARNASQPQKNSVRLVLMAKMQESP
jgi:hypothetical protein